MQCILSIPADVGIKLREASVGLSVTTDEAVLSNDTRESNHRHQLILDAVGYIKSDLAKLVCVCST